MKSCSLLATQQDTPDEQHVRAALLGAAQLHEGDQDDYCSRLRLPDRHPRPRHPRQLRLSCCRRQPQHCLAGKSSALRTLMGCHEMNGTVGSTSPI